MMFDPLVTIEYEIALHISCWRGHITARLQHPRNLNDCKYSFILDVSRTNAIQSRIRSVLRHWVAHELHINGPKYTDRESLVFKKSVSKTFVIAE